MAHVVSQYSISSRVLSDRLRSRSVHNPLKIQLSVIFVQKKDCTVFELKIKKLLLSGSNSEPSDYETDVLPTVLQRPA